MTHAAIKLLGLGCILSVLGCSEANHPNDQNAEQKIQIKPAVKLGTDASVLAHNTDAFLATINLEQLQTQIDRVLFEQQIFKPVRELLVRWSSEIKQSDSVVGDQYTICRGALISLDAWGRAALDQPKQATLKQQIYRQQQVLCSKAVSNAHTEQ